MPIPRPRFPTLDSPSHGGTPWPLFQSSASKARGARSLASLRQFSSITIVPYQFEASFFRPFTELEIRRGDLPHWCQEGVSYFVTFRLADAIPQTKLRKWRRAKMEWLARNPPPRSNLQNEDFHRQFTAPMEAWLDAGLGSCTLKCPTLRRIVEDALRHFEGERYQLGPATVAPNHVHAIVSPREPHSLQRIVQSWKSFSAKAINREAGRVGTLWQKEYFDHIIRNPASFWRISEYIRNHESSQS
jgi:REP element-mobilizing transposase RayT